MKPKHHLKLDSCAKHFPSSYFPSFDTSYLQPCSYFCHGEPNLSRRGVLGMFLGQE